MLSQFASDSDIHGIKYVMNDGFSKIHRAMWACVLLGAITGFMIFAGIRVQSFLSYPYSVVVDIDQNNVPVPAIAICPIRTRGIDYEYYNNFGLSDVELVYLYKVMDVYNINYMDENSTSTVREQHRLDEDKMEYLKSVLKLNSSSSVLEMLVDEKLTPPSLQNLVYPLFTTDEKYERRIKKLKSLVYNTSKTSWNYKKEFNRFIWKFGLGLRYIAECKFYTSDNEVVDCMDSFKEEITDSGLCAVIRDTEGVEYTLSRLKKDKQKGLMITLSPDINNLADFRVKYFYKDIVNPVTMYNGGPSVISDMQSTKFRKNIFVLSIIQSYSTSILDEPYHNVQCQKDNGCTHECFVKHQNCSLFYFDISDQQKPLCPLEVQESVFYGEDPTPHPYIRQTLNMCENICKQPCKQVRYNIEEQSSLTDLSDDVGAIINVKSSNSLRYEEFTEIPVYSVSSLLAELGGTFGLFVGASLISLWHLIEYPILGLASLIGLKQNRA